MKIRLNRGLWLLFLAGQAWASTDIGLASYFVKALHADSQYAAAQSTRDAEVQYQAMGRAGLLPSVALTATHDQAQYARTDLTPGAVQSDYSYDPSSISLRITQPLYNRDRWAFKHEGEVRAERAELVLMAARQDLALRLAQVYWNYLLSADQLALAQAQAQALQAQQQQAEHLFQAGMATRTDVEESRSREQLAQVQIGAAKSNREQKKREFVTVVGEPPSPDLQPLINSPVLSLPEPADESVWVEAARSESPLTKAQQAALTLASIGVERAKAGFYPSLSLVANKQSSQDPNYFTHAEQTTQWGIQLNMSLFEGGTTLAQSRQAQALVEKARNELEAQAKAVENKASQAYWDVVNGVGQIKAMEQALLSAETTLVGMKVGQSAGLRTNSEVLNAQQQVFAVRRDLQKERYSYLLNRLALMAAVGSLDEQALKSVDLMTKR